MRSVLALVVAVAMVAGAYYFRYGRDGASSGPLVGGEPPALLCATELKPVCDAVAREGVSVIVEDAPTTAAGLSGDSAEPADGWLVPGTWPATVDETRARTGLPALFGAAGPPLARSPVVLMMWRERAAVLARTCDAGVVGWDCLGRAAGGEWAEVGGPASWGRVKPAHDDPTRSSVGALVLGAAVADRLDTVDFSARDLESDRFLTWFRRLEQAVPTFGTARGNLVRDMLAFGPSRYDAVGTVEALGVPLLARSAQGDAVEVFYPQPLVTADVVLAPFATGGQTDRLRGIVEEVAPGVLAAAGWRVAGEAPPPGVPSEPTLPEAPQAPPPGVLEALQGVWSEETR